MYFMFSLDNFTSENPHKTQDIAHMRDIVLIITNSMMLHSTCIHRSTSRRVKETSQFRKFSEKPFSAKLLCSFSDCAFLSRNGRLALLVNWLEILPQCQSFDKGRLNTGVVVSIGNVQCVGT